jgi:hypothetical protein
MPRRNRLLQRPRLRRIPEGSNPLHPLPRGADTIAVACREATLQQLLAARTEIEGGIGEEYRFAYFTLTGEIAAELRRRFEVRLAQPKPLTLGEVTSWGLALRNPALVKQQVAEKRNPLVHSPKVMSIVTETIQ